MKFFAVASLFALAAAAPNGGPQCTPATYSCLPNNSGWQVCGTDGRWVFAGTCPPETVCKFYPPSKSPYCVPPNFQIP